MDTTLGEEIGRTKPFASLHQEAYLGILRTAAGLEHGLSEMLKPHGITHTQYNVLRILRGAGDRGLCRNDVRDRMVAKVPDATRLLDRMEAMGLIERQRDSEDRRYVTARITPEGRALLEELDDPVLELHDRQLGALEADELRTLIGLLQSIRRSG
jgi:DNA-binding MarR family transcriptional regulator